MIRSTPAKAERTALLEVDGTQIADCDRSRIERLQCRLIVASGTVSAIGDSARQGIRVSGRENSLAKEPTEVAESRDVASDEASVESRRLDRDQAKPFCVRRKNDKVGLRHHAIRVHQCSPELDPFADSEARHLLLEVAPIGSVPNEMELHGRRKAG
jgi:hypothetical protein